jgi:hypothetical protein
MLKFLEYKAHPHEFTVSMELQEAVDRLYTLQSNGRNPVASFWPDCDVQLTQPESGEIDLRIDRWVGLGCYAAVTGTLNTTASGEIMVRIRPGTSYRGLYFMLPIVVAGFLLLLAGQWIGLGALTVVVFHQGWAYMGGDELRTDIVHALTRTPGQQ